MTQCIDFQSLLCTNIDLWIFDTSSSTNLEAILKLLCHTVSGTYCNDSGYFNIMKVKKENAEAESATEQKESKKEHLNVKVHYFVLFHFFLLFSVFQVIWRFFDCLLVVCRETLKQIYQQMENGGLCRQHCWNLSQKVKRDVKSSSRLAQAVLLWTLHRLIWAVFAYIMSAVQSFLFMVGIKAK